MEKGILKYFNTVYKKYNSFYKFKVNTCLRLAKLKKEPYQIFDDMVDDLHLVSTPELAQDIIDKLFNVEYHQLRNLKVIAFSALISNLIKDESTKENILAKSKFNNEANSILFKFSKKLMLLQSKLEKTAEDITEAFFAEDAILREVALLHN